MIGRLLGHAKVETTARYAHPVRDSVHEAAAQIAADIGADLLGGGGVDSLVGPGPCGQGGLP